jgi:adenylate cyclase
MLQCPPVAPVDGVTARPFSVTPNPRRPALPSLTHARRKRAALFLIGDAGRVAHSRLLQLAVRFTPQAQRGRPKLRFIPNIRFGTEGYPEKVARRLRAVNVAAWILAPGTALFAVERFLDGSSHWKYTALVALAYASTPLLHRFGPLAAPLVLVGVGYTFIFWVSSIVGTDGGTYFFYSTAAALGILLLGAERAFLSVVLGAVAAGLIILLHIVVPRNTGVVPARSLFSGTFVINVLSSSALLYGIIFYSVRQFSRAEERAEREYERSERLLINILPTRVAERLKDSADSLIADSYPEASIMFTDMAGFTARASDTAPEELVRFLNAVYTRIDSLVERHGLEKIKTTGDAYMVVSGVPEALPNHAGAVANLSLDIRDVLTGLVDPSGRAVPVRIGIASGPVVAGVIGTRKFFYDVWGDAVNVASRMESTGVIGKIQVSQDIYERLSGEFLLESRGVIDVKGKGEMQTWFLIGRKALVGARL